MRNRRDISIAANPILIGAATLLVTVVGVFLAYNANNGLPFAPTYDVKVLVPDAAELVKGNDVRVGGKRIGAITSIEPVKTASGRFVSQLDLKLEKAIEPLRSDTVVTVRPRSTLGLKYLELVPGHRGRPVRDGGTLPLSRARDTVELDQVIDTFDAQTRLAAQRALDQGGPALAGRGENFNAFVGSLPELVLRVDHVARNLSDPRTGLRPALHALARVAQEVSPVAAELGSLVGGADRTFAALASVSPYIGATLSELPDTELVGIQTPGVVVLPEAAERLHAALQTGIPVLRRASALSDRLRDALQEVYLLSSDPLARSTLSRLRVALTSLLPVLRYVAPLQTTCNYLAVYLRNIASTVSEGDAAGNWLRTLTIANPGQEQYRSSAAPDLHANPYPYTGQNGICETGNEPYKPGTKVIGHAPGAKAHYTENISPPGGSAR